MSSKCYDEICSACKFKVLDCQDDVPYDCKHPEIWEEFFHYP